MPHSRATTPSGHGELVVQPAYAEWAALASGVASAVSRWDFDVAGIDARELRAMARSEAVQRARVFSDRIGVPVRSVPDSPELLVMTGHQPELYHPGVWVKDFLLQRLSDETGATAIDLVVDSDGFDSVGVRSPCLRPEVRVCQAYLATGVSDGSFASAPVPSAADLALFREAGMSQLTTLPAPSIPRHFSTFCDALDAAAPAADNLAELITFARRRYEAGAGTDYLELPVTSMAGSRAFAALVAHLAFDVRAFADAYNGALAAYRTRTGTRSAAQPFPDLGSNGDLVELPLWSLSGGRHAVWVRTGVSPALIAAGEVVCELGTDVTAAIEALLACGASLAPKALMLTLFARMFVADLFIHGVGGGRYDQVTDDVARRYFGVEAPPLAVASLTVYLPLGSHVVSDAEVEAAVMALNRLAHNPDQVLAEVEFDTDEEAARASGLAAEKRDLVARIAAPDADKKTLGLRIREVNTELAALLEPVRLELADHLEEVKRLREASEVLTDRTYPFCLWDPREIADKVG